VGGFFVSRMCRKLVFVNRRGAKKPFERGAFEWKALGKANGQGRQCEALAVPAAERLFERLWVNPMARADNAKHWQSRV
jgi:hypothetical protein